MQPALREGLVLRVDAKVCHVEIDGARCTLPLAGKLFEQLGPNQRPLAVGDRVLVRPDASTGGAIDALLPRQSQLHRRATRAGEERAQVVAANITLVLVVTAVAEPPFQPELVDGVLAAAMREGIPSAIVLTKLDRDRRGEAERWIGLYRGLGYRVLPTSTQPGHETGPALAELAALLHSNRSVLCGLSGVGKSTLLNAIVPGLQLRVGSLTRIRQGRHTTSHTELIPLPGGGHVLDTPGIRSFHLFHVGSQETQFLFPELAALLPGCAYRSCLHLEEPGCAVTAARQRGEVAPSRYASYVGLVTAALQAERPGARSDPRAGDAGGGRSTRRAPRS
jgi:ribosome biogenesis GTPase